MTTEIRVPTLGESVTEATIAKWFKAEGDMVSADETLVELETDKITVEVPAPAAGVLSSISVKEGDTVEVGALLGSIGEGNGAVAKKEAPKEEKPAVSVASVATAKKEEAGNQPVAPSVRRIVSENELDLSKISGTGKDGRITKEDALKAAGGQTALQAVPPVVQVPTKPAMEVKPVPGPAETKAAPREERVRMTRLRQTIAKRLKDVQNTAAMLTTFNEVDMGHLMALRAEYKDVFEKKHGVRLGFMSFFVKACVTALKDIPAVNGEIDGEDIVYKNHYDLGVAVGTDRGLVVPVIRDADQLSLAGIEKAISTYGTRARNGELKLEDLQGGTFTISNGGVYGSLMSTPILNPPQSGILGMHKIQERPVAIKGEMVVRPMMYLALSYDHRIVDGKEAVTFLVRVKECIETPERLLLDL